MINFKRDKYHRTDPPCKICAEHGKHQDGTICPKYTAWKKRNASKQNLMRPQDIQTANDNDRSIRFNQSVVDDANILESLDLIDRFLDVDLRAIYIRMRYGESVPKAKRLKVENAIKEILSGRKKTEQDG